MVDCVCQRAVSHAGGVGDCGSGDWRLDCWGDGEVRIVKDQGAWDSGSDGSCADQSQPDRTEGCNSETDFGGDCDWDRRAVWRGRADHSDGRGDWIISGAGVAYDGGRAESAAGLWSGGGDVGDV